jgi:hypothetical protein
MINIYHGPTSTNKASMILSPPDGMFTTKEAFFIQFSDICRGERYTVQKSARKAVSFFVLFYIPYYALAWSQLLTGHTKNTQVWLGKILAVKCNAILYRQILST